MNFIEVIFDDSFFFAGELALSGVGRQTAVAVQGEPIELRNFFCFYKMLNSGFSEFINYLAIPNEGHLDMAVAKPS